MSEFAWQEEAIDLKIFLSKGGEVDEMDVSPCNSLFDLRLNTSVLSKTRNGSFEEERMF